MKITICVILILVVFALLRAWYENTHYEIEYKDIIDSRVKGVFKVLFFADLHNTLYGKNNIKLLKDIEQFAPDIILIAGDLFVSKEKEMNINARNILAELIRSYKVVFTFGNHETKLRNAGKYRYPIDCLMELENADGFIILNNDRCSININENKLNIIGYEADLKYYKKMDGVSPDVNVLKEVLGDNIINNDEISFMLAHNPNFFDVYAEFGVDYVFSGHNHGGIVRLPFIGGVISTGFRPFPKYYGGEYKKGKTKMFVTRGLGSHTIRFRLFNLPQVHMFTFKGK